MDFSISPAVSEMVQKVNAFVDRELIPLEPRFYPGRLWNWNRCWPKNAAW